VLPHAGRLRIPDASPDFTNGALAIGRKLNLSMLDATEPIRGALDRGEEPMQFDNTHFNEAGHWLMAKWLHEQLPTAVSRVAE